MATELDIANARIKELEEGCEKLRQLANANIQQLFDMRLDDAPYIVWAIAETLHDLLDEHNAPNYLEVAFDMKDSEDRIVLTIHRPKGKTPSEIKADLEAKIADLSAKLSKYEVQEI